MSLLERGAHVAAEVFPKPDEAISGKTAVVEDCTAREVASWIPAQNATSVRKTLDLRACRVLVCR